MANVSQQSKHYHSNYLKKVGERAKKKGRGWGRGDLFIE